MQHIRESGRPVRMRLAKSRPADHRLGRFDENFQGICGLRRSIFDSRSWEITKGLVQSGGLSFEMPFRNVRKRRMS